MPRITKRIVDAAKPTDARYYVWDDEVKGFGLLVLPSGVKSYFYRYRTPEGRERRATIGKHGTATADSARAKAKEWQRTVSDGGDPLAVKKEAREALTIAQVLDLYLESAAFAAKAKSTQAIDRGRIERHLKPVLGKTYADKLTPEAVHKAAKAIGEGKTAGTIKTRQRGLARVKGGAGTARMAITLLRAALKWAVSARLISHNGAEGVSAGVSGTRDTIMRGPEDYENLFRTLDTMEAERRLKGPVADAIRVIALTGARRGEIAGLRWQYVDLRAGQITLPPSHHKTGRKTGKPRVIGLPTAAQQIIASQTAGKPDDYVFPPASGDGPVNLSKPWRAIRAEAGLPEGIGLHGLRHSLASHMAMQGAAAAEIMTTLGHRQMSTAQKYVHFAQDARVALAEKAAAMVTGALKGAAKADVVSIKGRTE